MIVHVTPLLLILAMFSPRGSHSFYVSHVLQFPVIPFSAGVYHIHSPGYFMEAHGFALPGFKILETRAPQSMGDYVTVEFVFETYFHGRTSARVFSSALNSSHVLVMDPDGAPCLLGRLSLGRCSSNGHLIRAHADLLRPANPWERMLGGKRLVKQCEVERAIRLGYSNFKSDLNLKRYMNLIVECGKGRDSVN